MKRLAVGLMVCGFSAGLMPAYAQEIYGDPNLPVAGKVLDTVIHTRDVEELRYVILRRLTDRYANDKGVAVTQAEKDAYIKRQQDFMQQERERRLARREELKRRLAGGQLSEAERKSLAADLDTINKTLEALRETDGDAQEIAAARAQIADAFIRQWKINRELYRQYGGRIIYQQGGPEPLDAYRRFLEERQARGDFVILNKNLEMGFWRYYRTDAIHSFYKSGSREEAQAFEAPLSLKRESEDSNVKDEKMRSAKPAAAKSAQRSIDAARDVPAAPENGGPRNWQVTGVSRGLNLRERPSTSAKIIAGFASGAILDNLGCLRAEGRVWCDVQQLGGGPRGYVAAEFLKPAVSPNGAVATGPDTSALRAGRNEFDATGKLPCALFVGQPMTQCDFGVARAGGGYATVVIKKPNGTNRAIFFRMGKPIGADTSQADGYPEFRTTKESDLNLIRVGSERYEIPDAVILGG